MEPNPNNPNDPNANSPTDPRRPQQTGVYNSLSLAPTPYDTHTTEQPQVFSESAQNLPGPAKKAPNKLIIIIIAGVSLLIVLVIVVFVASQSQKPKTNQANTPATNSAQPQNLEPAQAIDLEQASNAISQDLSSLDDEKDFPATSLDDKTLGL